MVFVLCRQRKDIDDWIADHGLMADIVETDTVDGRVWFVVGFTSIDGKGVPLYIVKSQCSQDFDYIKLLKKHEIYGDGRHLQTLIPKRLRSKGLVERDPSIFLVPGKEHQLNVLKLVNITDIQNQFGKPIVLQKEGTLEIVCPYCRDIHEHGMVNGHRSSHCNGHGTRVLGGVEINGKMYGSRDGYTIFRYRTAKDWGEFGSFIVETEVEEESRRHY